MKQPKPLTRACVHCGAPAQEVRYHSRYSTQDGMRIVLRCRCCKRSFCDRYGTAFYDLKTPEEKVERAVHQVLEGLGYESIARIERVHPTTVHRWVARASEQAQLADMTVVQQVKAATIELDELYGFAGTKQHAPESIEDSSGKHWVHCSMVRDSRLLLDVVVGPRTLETAQMLVYFTALRLKSTCWPLWCSDGWESYVEALLSFFYITVHFIRTKRRGRPRLPKPVPHPNLRYGQIVKHHSGRKLISITKRVRPRLVPHAASAMRLRVDLRFRKCWPSLRPTYFQLSGVRAQPLTSIWLGSSKSLALPAMGIPKVVAGANLVNHNV